MKKNIIAQKCLKNWLKLGVPWKIKEGKYNDKNTFCVTWQDSGVKVLEGNYCDKLRQIGAIGLVGHYGFTAIEGLKIESAKQRSGR